MPDRAHQRRHEHQVASCLRQSRASAQPVRHDRQVNDYIGARALLSSLPDVDWLLGDRGYDADWFREALKDKGVGACILGRKEEKETDKVRQPLLQTT